MHTKQNVDPKRAQASCSPSLLYPNRSQHVVTKHAYVACALTCSHVCVLRALARWRARVLECSRVQKEMSALLPEDVADLDTLHKAPALSSSGVGSTPVCVCVLDTCIYAYSRYGLCSAMLLLSLVHYSLTYIVIVAPVSVSIEAAIIDASITAAPAFGPLLLSQRGRGPWQRSSDLQ